MRIGYLIDIPSHRGSLEDMANIDGSYRNSFKVSDQYTNRVSCHPPYPLFLLNLKSLFNSKSINSKWVVSRPEMSRKCGQNSRKFSHRLTRVFARTLSGIYRCAIWGVSGVSNAQSLLVRSIAPQLTNRNTRRCLWHQ